MVMKRLSDALFLISIVLLVAAIVTRTPLLYLASGFLFLDAFVVTAMKRRQFRAKALKQP